MIELTNSPVLKPAQAVTGKKRIGCVVLGLQRIVERFFRPFLAGVFFDPALSVSSRAFEFCFRAFAAGDKPVPAKRGTTCLYFAAAVSPIDEAILVLNATGQGPVSGLVVPSLLSRDYAPAGDSLIPISAIGIPAHADALLEAAVRDQTRGWFGAAVDGWHHLKTLRIPDALPLQIPPVENPRYRDPRRADWLYVCGEYCNAPTINWALYSGRRAAETLVAASDLHHIAACESGPPTFGCRRLMAALDSRG